MTVMGFVPILFRSLPAMIIICIVYVLFITKLKVFTPRYEFLENRYRYLKTRTLAALFISNPNVPDFPQELPFMSSIIPPASTGLGI